jgi:hypothetical protein
MTILVEAQCMARDNYRCVRCGHYLSGVWPGYSCHHRQSRSVGPDTLDNRIMLCGSGTTGCHGYVHAHPVEARDKGWIVSRHVKRDEITAVAVEHHQLGLVRYDANGGYELVPA